MQTQSEHVLESMTPQLVPGDRASNPALPANDDMGTDDDTDNSGEERRSKSNAILRHRMAQRLITARELNGVTQTEAAKMLGLGNSTQLSLWEQARRPVPLQLVSHLATVFGVSTDFLLGVDDEPERNSRLAARNLLVRRMSGMLERNAQSIADVLLETHRFDSTPVIRSSRVCTLVAELCDGIDLYRSRNQDAFDDTPCSALLMRTAREAREAIETVSAALDRADFRAEHALTKAREALHAPIPELPPGPAGAPMVCRL